MNDSDGKAQRLDFLLHTIGLAGVQVDDIRYQLLHRTASALIEARRYGAQDAVMLVHSFSAADTSLKDYQDFVSLYRQKNAGIGKLTLVMNVEGVNLYLGWAKRI